MQDSFNLKDCSENFLTFIQACMQTDVSKRKTIDQLMEMDIMREANQKDKEQAWK